jgi:hypothetical protein
VNFQKRATFTTIQNCGVRIKALDARQHFARLCHCPGNRDQLGVPWPFALSTIASPHDLTFTRKCSVAQAHPRIALTARGSVHRRPPDRPSYLLIVAADFRTLEGRATRRLWMSFAPRHNVADADYLLCRAIAERRRKWLSPTPYAAASKAGQPSSGLASRRAGSRSDQTMLRSVEALRRRREVLKRSVRMLRPVGQASDHEDLLARCHL